MSESIYYLKVSGQVEGPFAIGQVYDLWAARKINSQTLFARFDEMDKWQPLSELTLKISAPKGTAGRESAPEPATTQPKSRTLPNFRTEEYYPSVPYPTEPKAEAPRKRSGAWRGWLQKTGSYSFWSGPCIVAGVLMTGYFMFFFSVANDGKEINQSFLAMKQNGVTAGVGLILMGGLLVIAQHLAEIVSSLRNDGGKRAKQLSAEEPGEGAARRRNS